MVAAAVYARGTMTVTASTFDVHGNIGGFSGAIIDTGPAVLIVAFTANSTFACGAAAATGAVTVTNSTFADNVARAVSIGAMLSFSVGDRSFTDST